MRALLIPLMLAACAPPPLEHSAPNARPLAGASWVMVVDSPTAPTLEFREAGRASGSTGCNQWFAQVDRTGGGLRFAAIGTTRRACEASVMEIERDFVSALERTHAAQVEDDALTLTGENGEAVARFERNR